MVPRPKHSTQGCLHIDDAGLAVAGEMITISFKRFKHIAKQGPQIVHVRGEKIGETSIHPAALMREYLQTRGRVEATLSAYMDGTSMSREEFDLALTVKLCWPQQSGVQMPQRYKRGDSLTLSANISAWLDETITV